MSLQITALHAHPINKCNSFVRHSSNGVRRSVGKNLRVGAFNPSLPSDNRPDEGMLHGVFLSTNLPPVLADYTSVYDARDAVETCSGVSGSDKDACYAIFGLDPGCEKWFDVVYNLEQALELETDPEETAVHHDAERC